MLKGYRQIRRQSVADSEMLGVYSPCLKINAGLEGADAVLRGRKLSHMAAACEVIFASDERSQNWDHFGDQVASKQKYIEQNKSRAFIVNASRLTETKRPFGFVIRGSGVRIPLPAPSFLCPDRTHSKQIVPKT